MYQFKFVPLCSFSCDMPGGVQDKCPSKRTKSAVDSWECLKKVSEIAIGRAIFQQQMTTQNPWKQIRLSSKEIPFLQISQGTAGNLLSLACIT